MAKGKGSEHEMTLSVAGREAPVSALLLIPKGATAILALAHGAGAGMRHAFMTALAESLATVGIATLRYQFPYMD